MASSTTSVSQVDYSISENSNSFFGEHGKKKYCVIHIISLYIPNIFIYKLVQGWKPEVMILFDHTHAWNP